MKTAGKRFRPFLNTAILLFTFGVHIYLASLAPEFEKVFSGFDSELPFLSRMFLPGSLIYWVLPAFCVAAYVAYWFRPEKMMSVLLACGIGSVLMIPAFIVAMYLPVFQLGAPT